MASNLVRRAQVFVGRLSWTTTADALKSYFSKFGEVTYARVITDKIKGTSLGYGFVGFKDPEILKDVLQQQHEIDGKIIDVKEATPRPNAGEGQEGGRREGFRGDQQGFPRRSGFRNQFPRASDKGFSGFAPKEDTNGAQQESTTPQESQTTSQ